MQKNIIRQNRQHRKDFETQTTQTIVNSDNTHDSDNTGKQRQAMQMHADVIGKTDKTDRGRQEPRKPG